MISTLLNNDVKYNVLQEATLRAVEEVAPVFVPSNLFVDDRGWSIMNQMQGVLTKDGQVNFSLQFPNVIRHGIVINIK